MTWRIHTRGIVSSLRGPASCAVGVPALFMLFASGPVLGQFMPMGPVFPDPCMPPALPGAARPWEASIDVSTYSSVNAVNRNVFTAIPIVSWSGLGPDIEFTLYHNSGAVGSTASPGATGFDLGPGWSASFGFWFLAQQPIWYPTPGGGFWEPGEATLVWPDGSRDVFTKADNTSSWVSPPGVFDELVEVGGDYRVVHKDQSFHEFTPGLGLSRIVDAVGNEVTFERQNARMTKVIDASGRELVFEHINGKLSAVVDTITMPGSQTTEDRVWAFVQTTSGLLKIIDPLGYEIDIDYDADGRITTITDHHEACVGEGCPTPPTYTYTYNAGFDQNAVAQVLDPGGHTPAFSTVCNGSYQVTTTYTDRRGQDWLFTTWRDTVLTYPENGPVLWTENPFNQRQTFWRDLDRNVTNLIDERNNEWSFTYDDRGNMLSATDPLLHTQTWAYGAVNNVTSYTDGANHTVTFQYDNPTYPTLLTSITEPPDGGVLPAAVTTLDYYLPGPSTPTTRCTNEENCNHGLLSKVVDAEGVETHFGYDKWGQLANYGEGAVPGGGGGSPPPPFTPTVYSEGYTNDSRSRIKAFSKNGVGSGESNHNKNNWPTGGSCIPQQSQGGGGGGVGAAPGFPPLPAAPVLASNFGDWSAEYTPMGLLKRLDVTLYVNEQEKLRTHIAEFNELNLQISGSVGPGDWGAIAAREFTYDPDLQFGNTFRTGPDGIETFVQLDEANRVEYFRRGPSANPMIEVSYTYLPNGLLSTVNYGNGTMTWFEYDAANRVTNIQRLLGSLSHELRYEYRNDNLPTSIEEWINANQWSVTWFTYDTRDRLIVELREGQNPYVREYVYDQVGNRKQMLDVINHRRVEYVYDIVDPETYGSDNHRLLKALEYDTSGTPDVLLSTTWYYYNVLGSVTRVVKNAAGTDEYESTWFEYAKNGTAVSYVLRESWTWDGVGDLAGYQILEAREFRYDGARQRYLNRKLDPAGLQQNPPQYVSLSDTWTDYDGDEPYGDFKVTIDEQTSEPTLTELRSFELGIATVDPWKGFGSIKTKYYHDDHLGTTLTTTDKIGTISGWRVRTAFGEPLAGPSDRYGYAGAWGYQSTLDETSGQPVFPFLHVGARYYDPSTARFLQRDPIGLVGGVNVYGYVGNVPTRRVDPHGLFDDTHFNVPPGWRPGSLTRGPTPPGGFKPDDFPSQVVMSCVNFVKRALVVIGGLLQPGPPILPGQDIYPGAPPRKVY